MANKFLPSNIINPNWGMPQDYLIAGKNWISNQLDDAYLWAQQQKAKIKQGVEIAKQQKANAEVMAQEIKKETQNKLNQAKQYVNETRANIAKQNPNSTMKGVGTPKAPTNQVVDQALDTLYGGGGPKINKGIGTAPGTLPTGTFTEPSLLKTPITKGTIGTLLKKGSSKLPFIGAGLEIGDYIQGLLSGRIPSNQALQQGVLTGMGIGGALAGGPYGWTAFGSSLAGKGLLGASNRYVDKLENTSPEALANGEFNPGLMGLYANLVTGTNLQKKVLKDENEPTQQQEAPDPSQDGTLEFLELINSGKAPFMVGSNTELGPAPTWLDTSSMGFHLDPIGGATTKDNTKDKGNVSTTTSTGVTGQSESSAEDILNFIGKLKSNPAYNEETGLWDKILGYGTSSEVMANDNPPVLRDKVDVQDPVVEALMGQLDKINKQLEQADKVKRDPVRDMWIAKAGGMSPTQVFGYPQSETDQLINLQKSLANQLTIYDKLTSLSRDKEERDAFKEALTKSGLTPTDMALLMNDKTAGPYVTNVLSKYLTQDLEDEKFVRDLQKLGYQYGLIGDNQMRVAIQQGVNSLMNTEAQGENTRANTQLQKYLDFIKEQYTQGQQNERQNARNLFDVYKAIYGVGSGNVRNNEITPYQQAQIYLKLAEQDPENADIYLGAIGGLLPNTGTTSSSGSKVKSISSLFN